MLHERIEQEFGRRRIGEIPIPEYVYANLAAGFELRTYQIDAIQRFIMFDAESFAGKQHRPYHLAFNMATGSGKTLVMASLMLYLYAAQGYRKFLFIVNSTNIIDKSKYNFIESSSPKYLFAQSVSIHGRIVQVREIDSLDDADEHSINIMFCTTQQLSSDVRKPRENAISTDDIQFHKVAIIADEAHHLNAMTAANPTLEEQSDRESWESIVSNVHRANKDNLLLEFTATLDYKNHLVAKKYTDKVLVKYDLAEFRKQGYSKDINLVRSQCYDSDRILHAILLNLYRDEVASRNSIDLKPVVLFKSNRVSDSNSNKQAFHLLIESLSSSTIDHIRMTYARENAIPVLAKAFEYFDRVGLTSEGIRERIVSRFRPENCVSVNDGSALTQSLVNTLEDRDNPVRAVFAVNKLNEGWDVLNLFDIVRLSTSARPAKSTPIAEAQLIGRGARYCPFITDASQDRYSRKFDEDLGNDFRVLEELYYHTHNDVQYIKDLKAALVSSGIYVDEDRLDTMKLSLKPEFKKSEFYRTGMVVSNKRIERRGERVVSFADSGLFRVDMQYAQPLNITVQESIFVYADGGERTDVTSNGRASSPLRVRMDDVPRHIVRYAASRYPFFHFSNLKRLFPDLSSMSEFFSSPTYMGNMYVGVELAATGSLTPYDYLAMTEDVLKHVQATLENSYHEFEGSPFTYSHVHDVFMDKVVRVEKNSERSDGQQGLVLKEPWYVYDANYGTSEEKQFVEAFSKRFAHLREEYDDIYLVRNERALKIYDRYGRAFEPDFVLFCRQKQNDGLIYQVFIEPKGNHLMKEDKWKEDFLKELAEGKNVLTIDADTYVLKGVPFYNHDHENEFVEALNTVL